MTFKLSYDRATYFGYKITVICNGIETHTEFTNITLEQYDNGETIIKNIKSDNEIPIFVYILILPLFIFAFVYALTRKN
jgi:hypothetical protein